MLLRRCQCCAYQKKDKSLRTVMDCRQRNDNTHQDVTPFPDQDNIRFDVARAKFNSKIDLSNAYEQTLIEEDDVKHTAFATVFGTYRSRVMQQGDCNAPATFQNLMTNIFHEYIGVFLHVYLDDIFVFSNSIEEHEAHLELVFSKLQENEFYVKESKCQLYSTETDCLGHLIDECGIHADGDKMAQIRNWRKPRNYLDVQRFLGLVQYLAPFIPNVSMYTTPLSNMSMNSQPFH